MTTIAVSGSESRPAAPWRSRIVRSAEVAPADLVPNERNWRLHPRKQLAALRGSLDTVGWVQQVLVNQTTGNVVDGHARIEEALSRNEPTVPVLYVDLTVEEEALVLATLDPIAAMATTDEAKLNDLLAELEDDDEFREAVIMAEARAEVSSVGAIAKAAKAGDWRAGVYLLEHARNREPLEAGTRCGSHVKRCRECQVPWKRCPHAHEIQSCRIAQHLCGQAKGKNTAHAGSGHCWLHLGRTDNGEKHAQLERAGRALRLLGVPVGTGDPFRLLAKTVQHAEGYLEATSELLSAAATDAENGAALPAFAVETASGLYEEAIRIAGRTGKAAVDADVADRLATLDERVDSLLWLFIGELLERVVPKAQRPAIEAWASMRLGELAKEYEHPVAVH